MRQRSTWQSKSRDVARQAATRRRADDIYSMNGDHSQPSPDAYENGNPDKWAETPASYDRVAEEYEGDHVKRNEIGMGEFRKDTWSGAGSKPWGTKHDASTRKVAAVTKIASALVGSDSGPAVRSVATALMSMSDRAVLATLKAMEASSASSMPQDVRFKRAIACTKLAARTLGPNADEATVERLARAFFALNDSSLRPIVKIVASLKLAQQQEEEEEEGQQAQQQEEEEEEEEGSEAKPKHKAKPKASKPHGHQAQQEEEEEEGQQAQQQEEEEEEGQQAQQQEAQQQAWSQQQQAQQAWAQQQQAQQQEAQQQAWGQEEEEEEEEEEGECLTSEEEEMLKQMTAPAAPAHVHAPADLSALFGAPAPAPAMPAMPAMPGMPAMASSPSISFDDDASGSRMNVASLEALFNDDPEVRAQREITASQKTGYNVHTASSKSSKAAKKLGTVQAARGATVESQLEKLWK